MWKNNVLLGLNLVRMQSDFQEGNSTVAGWGNINSFMHKISLRLPSLVNAGEKYPATLD